MSVDRRVAIVTGAARGLGRGMAEGLLEAGLGVVAMCRPRGAADAELPSAPDHDWVRVDGDVTDPADCARVVEAALDSFGRVDVLVNNAALSHDAFPKYKDSDFSDIELEAWRRIVDVNVTGPFLMTRTVAPHLVAQGWGRIVNISTSRSTMVMPGVLPYGPTKAALGAMTVSWAAHLAGTGVTVNEVAPGGATGREDEPRKSWRPAGSSLWSASMMVPPVRWLASSASDGVTSHRFVARLWDASLPDAVAAVMAGTPAAQPLLADLDHKRWADA